MIHRLAALVAVDIVVIVVAWRPMAAGFSAKIFPPHQSAPSFCAPSFSSG